MPPPWRLLPRAALSRIPPRNIRHIADARPFREGDHVILRPTSSDPSKGPLLRGPLRAGRRIDTHRGSISQDDIISKRVRDTVRCVPSKSGRENNAEFRLHEVKLEEYVRLSRRLVTPVYPWDAGLIAGLLDLHPDVYDPAAEDGGQRLEILEAGTGHGALTLYLSRAIHAANPPKPKLEDSTGDGAAEEGQTKALEDWKARRRALIHTVEIKAAHSRHAEATVRAFRQGLYADNIDFHIGDVGDWLTKTLPERNNEPFLSAAFLDLLYGDSQLEKVAQALRVDGTLIVFNPSITQIMECAAEIKRAALPLEMETVIECGVNGGTGGREWDVRPVNVRKASKAYAVKYDAKKEHVLKESSEENAAGLAEAFTEDERSVSGDEQTPEEEAAVREGVVAEEEGARAEEDVKAAEQNDGRFRMVCRPKVGDRIVGGGFLGVWKKIRV